jgi:hypothetical protein
LDEIAQEEETPGHAKIGVEPGRQSCKARGDSPKPLTLSNVRSVVSGYMLKSDNWLRMSPSLEV